MAATCENYQLSCQSQKQFLQRNLRTCNRDFKLQWFKAYVKPITEYASLYWNINNKDVLNHCGKDSGVSKTKKELKFESVELRRKVKNIKLMHSIASQNTFLSNAIKQTYAGDRVKFKSINARI